jgi:HD-GYP domain-containing protein (c-di-GMP phosphodiesterase class II)
LYRAQGIALGLDEIDRLIASGVKALYISTVDQEAYSAHLQRQILSGDELPVADRYQLLQATTRCVLENAFSDADVGRLVEVTTKFGQHLTDTLCDQTFLMGDLFTLMVHDYFTFHHAMNVSTYCVALALEMGISSKEDLVAIASGGLLHDIGKRGISPAVLGKAGHLDEEERELMRRHAQWGFEALSPHASVNWGQLMMVYQHHERTDGSGYPVGVLEGDIHPWAKICAVADVFDALTCDRPYRKAMNVAAGLSFLQRHAGVSFDKEIVECLTKTMRQK